MIAAGVALGFGSWFVALLAGFVINGKEGGIGFFLMIVSFVLLLTSFWMVAP